MTENQRLKILIKELEFTSQKDFANAIGIAPGSLSDILREKEGLGVSKAIKHRLETDYGVSKKWIESGQGPIFKESFKRAVKTDNTTTDITPTEPLGSFNLIPMYNFPSAASDIQLYNNPEEVKVIGHLNLPGSTKNSFALPVYGHSMYPTLENGCWCVLRPLENPQEIVWGEIYYIEWGDYRMFKRLLKAETDDKVILWSDNQLDLINDKPKYSPVTIKKEKIRRLCLLTDIVKKPNY